jgi:hypothetical protein
VPEGEERRKLTALLAERKFVPVYLDPATVTIPLIFLAEIALYSFVQAILGLDMPFLRHRWIM